MRFKCQRLADAGARWRRAWRMWTLNPVRADLAETPEESEFCGAGDRLRARRARAELAAWDASGRDESKATEAQKRHVWRKSWGVERARWLSPLDAEEGGVLGNERGAVSASGGWTGPPLARGQSRSNPGGLGSGVLERLDLDVENWLSTVERYGSLYHWVAGNVEKLREAAREGGVHTVHVATGKAVGGCSGWRKD